MEAAAQGGAEARHAARGAAGRLLRLAGRPGRPMAQEGQGRRHHPGLRRRRRDDRLHPDRRHRRGRRPGPVAAGRRRAHPAGRRQHGPGAGLRRRRDAAPGHGGPRRRPAGRARARLPHGQGDALHRPQEERRPGDRAGPGLEGHRRLGQDRADPRDAANGADRWLPARLRTDRPARARPPGRPDRDRPAVRRRPGDHPPPGAVPGPAGGLAAHRRARRSSPRRSCSTAASSRRPSCGGESSRSSPTGPAGRSPSWSRPTSTWPWPTGPPTTARSGAAGACGSGAAWRGRTTSASRPPRRPSPGVAPPIKALCVVPMGMEEGTETDVPGPEIGLVVGEPAQFRFLGSTTRRDDAVGTDPRALEHRRAPGARPARDRPRSRDDGSSGEPVPVRLHSHVTEVGTLELSCQSTRDDRRWKLEFNVRESTRGLTP